MTDKGILLAVDIGNTNITLGAFDGDQLRESWRISTERHRMADEYRPLILELLRGTNIMPGDLEGVILASVVPPVLAEMSKAFEKLDVPITVLRAGLDFGLKVEYNPPEVVGADRLANATAAMTRYGKPAIIVDLGTATTIDVVNADGGYIGGSIGPGLEASMEALFRGAFQLPRLQLTAPETAIGKTTIDSIRSGGLLGWAAMVDGLIDRFLLEIEGNPVIVGTGGLAPLVSPHSRRISVVDVDLTLYGLQMAQARCRAANPSKGQ